MIKTSAQSRSGRLPWQEPAKQALSKVPIFVRPLVRRKVEDRVKSRGGLEVTLTDIKEAEAKFRAVTAGKSEDELKSQLPAKNQPGVEMVVAEACRSQLSGCPNSLIDAMAWRKAVLDWVETEGISERLRERVQGNKVLFHHKLRISIAGCPNGCSRPQIADMALVGFVRPSLDNEDCCLGCAQCAQDCPDNAIIMAQDLPNFDMNLCQGCKSCFEACPEDCISISDPMARVLMGGKLGRHPHLAVVVAEVEDPAQAIALMFQEVESFLAQARPKERFAAWRVRTRQ